MTHHLGHGQHQPVTNPGGNARNGRSQKTPKGEFGALPIELPCDRHGSFEPQLIARHQTRWTGFDDGKKVWKEKKIAWCDLTGTARKTR